jgi:hypothetical protein
MTPAAFRTAIGIQQRIDVLTDFLSRTAREGVCHVSWSYGGGIKILAGPVVEAIEAELVRARAELASLGVEVTP